MVIKELTSEQRKNMPIYSGVLKYFPDALLEISKVSKAGNDKHNPGEPLHWNREKSTDESDALIRHLIDHEKGDLIDESDGQLHLAHAAWRILAWLQKELENAK